MYDCTVVTVRYERDTHERRLESKPDSVVLSSGGFGEKFHFHFQI